jgi:hypothetical protein
MEQKCQHVYTKGSKKGQKCCKKTHNQYCSKHKAKTEKVFVEPIKDIDGNVNVTCQYIMLRGVKVGKRCDIKTRNGNRHCTHHLLKKFSPKFNLSKSFMDYSDVVLNIVVKYLKWSEIDKIYRVNKELYEYIKEDREHIYNICHHVLKHSYNDEPIIEHTLYTKRPIARWYRDGVLHRRKGPAEQLIDSDGSICKYIIKGKYHTDDDTPAISIRVNQTKIEGRPDRYDILEEWYKHGERHRDGFQPAYVHHNFWGGFEFNYYKYGMKIKRQDLSKWNQIHKLIDESLSTKTFDERKKIITNLFGTHVEN